MTGRPQSYFNGSEELRGFELAWSTAYLSLFDAPQLRQFIAGFGALSNSKFAGRQRLRKPPRNQDECRNAMKKGGPTCRPPISCHSTAING
ncbi:MAG: hypothetical protein Q8Q26_02275 [Pseudorhodobacter sp.]|nr:hypothetical protein [Pseudorhodobacter sp.]